MRSLLDSNAKLVLSALVNINRNGTCTPGRQFIADATGLSTHQVKRAVVVLRERKLITTRKGQRGNSYKVAPLDTWGALLSPNPAGADSHQRAGADSHRRYKQEELTRRREASASSTASSTVANREPVAAAAKKPPTQANGYTSAEVEDWRLMLNWHGRLCQLPPVDDGMLYRLMNLTRGSPAPKVHNLLKDLLRNRLDSVRSWGLFPLVLEPWFKNRRAG